MKLQPVPPSMPPEALLITKNRTDSASDGIDGSTGCNFIYFLFLIYLDIIADLITIPPSLASFNLTLLSTSFLFLPLIVIFLQISKT